MNLNLNNLKMPGGQAPPAVTGPLLPTQAVFRQKPWLPWWVAIVIPLLALLALLLFLFLPKNVKVPDVVGKKSAFEAEKTITEAGLKLAPATKEKVNAKLPPGHRPEPDAERRRDGREGVRGDAARRGRQRQGERAQDRRADARRRPRRRCATPVSRSARRRPSPSTSKAKIKSQIPEEKEILKEGAPVDIFLEVPGAAKGEAGGDGSGRGGRRRRRRRRRRRGRGRHAQGARDRRRRPGRLRQAGGRRRA